MIQYIAIVFRGSAFNCSRANDELILLTLGENIKHCSGGLIVGYKIPRMDDYGPHQECIRESTQLHTVVWQVRFD